MKRPDIVFRRLLVRRMPGFDDAGFELDELAAGVNIITGRNASGKTTAARALSHLLWPSEADDREISRADLLGEVDLGGEKWTLEVSGGHVSHVHDGVAADDFPGPAEQTRDRYNLSLHELIQAEDEEFAERIRRESAGGYDLAAASERLEFAPGIRNRNVGEYQRFLEARDTVRQVRREQEALKDDERRLDTLKQERSEARSAQRRAELLRLALDVRELEIELDSCEKVLAAFPEGVEAASGEEYDEIVGLNEDIGRALDQMNDAEERHAAARETIDELSVPADGVSTERLNRLSEHRRSIEKLDQELVRRQEDLVGVEGELGALLEELHEEFSADEWDDIDLEDVKQLDRFAEISSRVQAEREAVRSMENWLGQSKNENRLETLQMGARTLRAWLRESGSASTGGFPPAVSVAAVLSAAAAGILAHMFGPLWWAGLVVAIALLAYGWHIYAAKPSEHRTQTRQQDYAQLDLEQPEAWTPEDVESILSVLTDELAEEKVEQERRTRWEMLEDRRQALEELQEELERRRVEIEEVVGPVSFVRGDVPLAHFLQKVRVCQQKRESIDGLEARITQLSDRIDDHVRAVNDELDDMSLPEVSSSAQAADTVETIEREYKLWSEASHQMETASRDLERLEQSVEEVTTRRNHIYEKLGLEPGDLAAVEDLVDEVESYEEKDKDAHAAREQLTKARAKLTAHEAYRSDIENYDRQELEEQLDDCRAAAERYDDVHREIIEIERLVEEHRNKHDLEVALARREASLDALEDLRAENLRALTGHRIAEVVREMTRYQSRPAVFKKADAILQRITAGRYKLVLDGRQSTSFQARDTQDDRTYALEELSSGTKIQLLLAVRLAFVEAQEQAVRFPLFVDEALANSDDVRARAIIEALAELSRDGRQIFYFTAQSDEVNKWLRTLDTRDIDYKITSLGEADPVRAADGGSDAALPGLWSGEVEDPEGHDHDSYGRVLDVRKFRPAADPVRQMHLWYLIEDVQTLHACLSRGIEAWGPLQTYLESGGQIPGVETDALAALHEKTEILEKVLELYRRGRSRPVPPSELRQTSAVTDNFIDAVTALLEEVDGDPERLIKGLKEGRVSRFQTSKRHELETYLEKHGYLDPDDVLPDEELRVRIRAIVSDHPSVTAEEIDRLFDRLMG